MQPTAPFMPGRSTRARDSGPSPDAVPVRSDSDEAEQALERLVFSLLDPDPGRKSGVRDYRSEADAAHLLYVAELEEQVREGDLDAMFHLSRALHDSAVGKCFLPDLHRAEALLVAAAHGGHPGAKKRLETDWPLLKATTERRIGEAA